MPAVEFLCLFVFMSINDSSSVPSASLVNLPGAIVPWEIFPHLKPEVILRGADVFKPPETFCHLALLVLKSRQAERGNPPGDEGLKWRGLVSKTSPADSDNADMNDLNCRDYQTSGPCVTLYCSSRGVWTNKGKVSGSLCKLLRLKSECLFVCCGYLSIFLSCILLFRAMVAQSLSSMHYAEGSTSSCPCCRLG